MKSLTIGVLALQGCVLPHKFHIEGHGACFKEVRAKEDLDGIDGLILPGGESSSMLKLIREFSLEEDLKAAFARMPVWGVCAGAILLAKQVESPRQWSFALCDITIERNAYGRQLDSFNATIDNYPVAFIRAPIIRSVGQDVETHALFKEHPVWVKSDTVMITTFHPELYQERPSSFHLEFIQLIHQFYKR
ncbi:MAG: pyridoxal 5'-phosphate synthase glutaminase subunit PdxT [Oligoflexia bacterium]|nr:pyridoxal 5'-phosphate synthase glutaminase subunit PdxT [Oligoflexia bacterium]MBF0366029.1 pyridoxal 5'-phosphate synthase glutaminase subunit PdxT [Oligoflexia bacterium]